MLFRLQAFAREQENRFEEETNGMKITNNCYTQLFYWPDAMPLNNLQNNQGYLLSNGHPLRSLEVENNSPDLRGRQHLLRGNSQRELLARPASSGLWVQVRNYAGVVTDMDSG